MICFNNRTNTINMNRSRDFTINLIFLIYLCDKNIDNKV